MINIIYAVGYFLLCILIFIVLFFTAGRYIFKLLFDADADYNNDKSYRGFITYILVVIFCFFASFFILKALIYINGWPDRDTIVVHEFRYWDDYKNKRRYDI